MNKPIEFDLTIGKKKPYSSRGSACPFCRPETLTDILERRGDMIWLMNKYPVFRGTWPTVLVETSQHHAELTDYTPEKLHEVISFGLEKWEEVRREKRFRSVLYFRNYGPQSGGSLRHPHSQIIGLPDFDYMENIRRENFVGPLIHEDADALVTLSDYPVCGMAEFNVTMKPSGHPDGFADALQTVARFLTRDFPMPCDSYNLFFYAKDRIHVKIFPRYIASPLYLGYKITQVMDEESKASMLEKLRAVPYFG